MIRRIYILFAVLVVGGCSSFVKPCSPFTADDLVYVVEQGWHVEIGLPVEELDEDLAFFHAVFPGARVIMFGYGKQTFITAPPDTLSEYFLGPFPGPAVIQTVGLKVTPLEAYPPENTITLILPAGGRRALSAYIRKDLTQNMSRAPMVVTQSTDPNGLFYASESEYSLTHTCNTWIADALHAAGFPISGNGVIFSYQVMARVETVAETQCGSVR
jgi:hypothetical protein